MFSLRTFMNANKISPRLLFFLKKKKRRSAKFTSKFYKRSRAAPPKAFKNKKKGAQSAPIKNALRAIFGYFKFYRARVRA